MEEAAIPAGMVNAGQTAQVEHRTTELEKAMETLVEENRETRSKVEWLAEVMENFMAKLMKESPVRGAEASTRADLKTKPPTPKEDTGKEPHETEKDAKEDPDNVSAKEPEEATTPSSAPRRSQRKR
ncbi:hypothetical protein AAHA92_06825 [Salvia divinorum]